VRTIAINLLAIDNVSKAMKDAAKHTDKLAKNLDGLQAASRGAGLVTLAAGAIALTRAVLPAAGAIGALPTAIGVAATAMATLKVGTSGVGKAMKDAATGDAKKLDKALKDLAPSARDFVKEFAATKTAFKPVQQAVQQRLFSGLAVDLHNVAGNLLPTVRVGMVQVAGALNGIAHEAMRAAATPWFQGAVARVFDVTAHSLTVLKGAVEPVMKAVTQLVILGAPLLDRFTAWGAASLKTGAAFLTSAHGIQLMTSIFQRGGDTTAQLGRVLLNLGVALKNIINASGQFTKPGQDMLTIVEQLTAKFAKWTGSAKGQRELANAFKFFGDTAQKVAQILPLTLSPLLALVHVLAGLPAPLHGAATSTTALLIIFGSFATKFAPLISGTFKFASAVLTFAKAEKTAKVATAIWTAVQWAFNTAMDANPIALVIIAIAALVAGAIYAYFHFKTFRDIVNAAFNGIKIAALAAWNYGLKYVWDAIKIYIALQIKYFTFWWNVAKAAWGYLVIGARAAWGFLQPIFAAIVNWLRGPLSVAWVVLSNLVKTVWIAIQIAIKLAWFQIKAIWFALKLYITGVLAPIFNWLWHNVVAPVWNAIRAHIQAVWGGIKIIWAAIRTYLIGPLQQAFNQFRTVAGVVWTAIKNVINSVWNGGIKPAFNLLKTGVNAVKTAFSTAVDGIKAVWSKLSGIAKTPVNFVIGLYNNGIVKLVNGIASLAGINTRLSPIRGFATGGVMPGYAPGRDSLMALVSPGEAIMRPEFTRALGPGTINQLNAVARTNGPMGVRKWLAGGGAQLGTEGMTFARGGVVPGFAGAFDIGGVVGGFLSKAKNFLLGPIDNAVKSIISSVLGKSVPGSGMFRDVIAGIPKWMASHLTDWLKHHVAGGGPGMQRALAFAKAQSGKPYVWGGVGPGGYDCSGFMSAITNVIHGKNPYSRLFSTASFNGSSGPGGFVRSKRSGFMVGVTNNAGGGIGHMAGTLLGTNVESSGSQGPHYGSGARGYNNPLFPAWYGLSADTGRLSLAPGWNPPVYNGTGGPEHLSTGGGQNIHLTVVLPIGSNPAQAGKQIADALREYKRSGGKIPT
jgi:hypothetical protein